MEGKEVTIMADEDVYAEVLADLQAREEIEITEFEEMTKEETASDKEEPAELNEKGLKKLNGSEKQVKWAESIRETGLKMINSQKATHLEKLFLEKEEASWFIEKWKMLTSEYKTEEQKVRAIIEANTRISMR